MSGHELRFASWVRWVAMDSNGGWHAFGDKPELGGPYLQWLYRDSVHSRTAEMIGAHITMPRVNDWRTSLRRVVRGKIQEVK